MPHARYESRDAALAKNGRRTFWARDYEDALRDAIVLKNRERRALATFIIWGS